MIVDNKDDLQDLENKLNPDPKIKEIEIDNFNKLIHDNNNKNEIIRDLQEIIKQLEDTKIEDRKTIYSQKSIINDLFRNEVKAKGSSNQGTTAEDAVNNIWQEK